LILVLDLTCPFCTRIDLYINPLRLESAHRNASQDHQVLWARTNLIDMEIEAID